MKNKKKFILSLSALAFCCIASGGALTAVKASADEIANTPQTVDFQMAAGAAIRIDTNADDNKDENGIRYQITMPETEYKALEENTAYESVSYGVLIAPKDYAAENPLNKANVFGIDDEGNAVEAVYDWAVKNETTGVWDYTGDGSKTRIMNFETDTLSVWSKNTAMRTYFGAIVNLNENNLIRDFVGVGYIKYETAASADYVFAAENDNVRSMSQVARLAYVDTSDQALDQDTKDDVKETYIDNVYGATFDFNEDNDKYLAKSGVDTSVVSDSVVSGVTGLQGTFSQPNGTTTTTSEGRQDLRIDLGGEYKIKEIQQIQIKYRVVESVEPNWWRIFLNDNTAEGQQLVNNTGLTFSGGTGNMGRDGKTMEYYATATIVPSETNSSTELLDEDYLYAISFGYRDETIRSTTIMVDSIVIYTGYDEKYLDFNETAALGIVTEGYNASIVDLGDGNKALQADLQPSVQQSDGSWSTRWNININLGSKYKVSQVESIEIGWRIGCDCASSAWWHIAFNTDTRLASGWDSRRVTSLSGGVDPTFASGTDIKNTVISNARIDATDNMDSNTVIENIFIATGSTDTLHVLQIDYIRINLY